MAIRGYPEGTFPDGYFPQGYWQYDEANPDDITWFPVLQISGAITRSLTADGNITRSLTMEGIV